MTLRLISIFVCALMLVGVTAERRSYAPPKSAVEYHARVKAASLAVPMQFGSWIGKDIPVSADAAKMLQPNVLINRQYQNTVTGISVGYLLVQSKDARAIQDHFPPVCYMTRGYEREMQVPVQWQCEDMLVNGTEYIFSRFGQIDTGSMVIDNFIIMPDGSFMPNMDAAKGAAGDLHKRFFGAAQFQLVFSRQVSEQDRQDAMQAFLGESRSVLLAIRSGIIK